MTGNIKKRGEGMKVLACIVLSMVSMNLLAAPTCGTSGSISERINDCGETRGSNYEFQLVTRTAEGFEIYKGQRTGVIWSADLQEGALNFYGHDVDDICSQRRAEFGGINANWVLPPIHRYIQALKYDIQENLPGISSHDYWTKTPDRFYVNSRYIFEGSKRYRENRRGEYTFRHLEADMGFARVKCIVEMIF